LGEELVAALCNCFATRRTIAAAMLAGEGGEMGVSLCIPTPGNRPARSWPERYASAVLAVCRCVSFREAGVLKTRGAMLPEASASRQLAAWNAFAPSGSAVANAFWIV